MVVWEKIRKGGVYHLVRVPILLFKRSFKAFGLSATDFGMNVKDGTKRYWTEDPALDPEEMAKDYSEYGSANMAINGTNLDKSSTDL